MLFRSGRQKWYREAAEQGDAMAQKNLGTCYLNGNGAEEDPEEAVEWFRKAADQNLKEAQFLLGYCYYKGKGIEEDPEKAVYWCKKSADQGFERVIEYLETILEGYSSDIKDLYLKAVDGDAEAQYNLGKSYANGQGVSKSHVKAVKWYTKAAEQGLAKAQNSLGYCYNNGLGVKQD